MLSPAWIAEQRAALPELPDAKRTRLESVYGIPAYDARVITGEVELAEYFESVVNAGADPKVAANWVMGEVMTSYNDTGTLPVSADRLAGLIQLVAAGTVSHQAAKRVYAEMASSDQDPRSTAERLGLIQVSDQTALADWVEEVLAAHPDEVDRFKAGETKLMGFFVGQVMKRSKGKADPKAVQPVLQSRLRIAAGTGAP